MPLSHDTILLETVRTRRLRLRSALLSGELSGRRLVNDNVRRVVGSCVLAAAVCVGCVVFAVVMTVLTAPKDGTAVRPAPTVSTAAGS
jgi:hypothetical protein